MDDDMMASLNQMQDEGRKTLDLAFILDSTGSMGSYLAAANKHIEDICSQIRGEERLSGPDDLRIAVVAYRDHPPQDHSYITKQTPFTNDISVVQAFLRTLHASGGGDGPEAVTAAMRETLQDLDWRPNAAKMVVLVADAPPHGIGEYGDGFPEGSPCGSDPLQIAREMARNGITMFVVGCEPALSGYKNGVDFFGALCRITSGMMLPLTTANLLAQAIIGSVVENLDMERLIREVGSQVAERLNEGNQTVDDVARELHEKLLLRNETTKKLHIENIYKESPEATHNLEVWSTSPDIQTAKPNIKRVIGSRFTQKYLDNRYNPSYAHTRLPPRPGAASTPISPTSPPRRVVSDFKAFGSTDGPKSASSVFEAPILKTGPGGGMFGMAGKSPESQRMRTSRGFGGGMDDDSGDEDEVTTSAQQWAFSKDAISLDQAKRIAIQSAWRSRA